MIESPRRGGLMAMALLVGGVIVLSGCAPSFGRFAPRARRGPVSAKPVVAPAPAFDPEERTTLTAIEDFLERTQQYRLPPPSPPPAPTTHASEAAPVTPIPHEGEPIPWGSKRSTEGGDATFANTQVVLPAAAPSADTPDRPVPTVMSVSIRPTPPEASPPPPAPHKSTNAPLEMERSEGGMSWDRILSHLEAQAAKGRDFDAVWRLLLVRLALGRDVSSLPLPPRLTQDAKDLVSALARAVAAVGEAARNPLLPGEEALERVDGLRRVLANRADPIISTVALCRRVVTFGVYDEMTKEDFVAGRSTQTIVYSEIQNLRAEQDGDGFYETRLSARLEILTPQGQSVWHKEEAEILDRCRRRRTDFFLAQRITLPPTLPAGEYVLKVLVEDQLSGKANEATHPFTIVSAFSIARSG